MLSDGVILLYDNTHIARKTQELLQKFKREFWSHPPYSPGMVPNLGSRHLSGTRFSSNSDMKTVVENWLNGQGRDFYQAGLNKLVLRLDKCLNRFGDYVKKLSAIMPLNSHLYFLSIVNKYFFIKLVDFFSIHPRITSGPHRCKIEPSLMVLPQYHCDFY
ncbi:hypothetical protein AVEN_173839-1 [Araneus ventricosus]|uniref:Histone-lysine N-methyltransferase SETMAR n=1 Tax=Araneus ventricosus TaxID=182803 RepID=A0A4Y2SMJ9_ARAVE|nr:hypothetical protein AVEN_33854-1 [Araneus ventricosus]GBN89367.1 hypothetical protein AVEN_173839-1 [Araneus ventricosus]